MVNSEYNSIIYPSGFNHYFAARHELEKCKIDTPKLIFSDDTRSLIPFDCVLVEFIKLDCFSAISIKLKTEKIDKVISDIGDQLGKIHKKTRKSSGLISNGSSQFDPVIIIQQFSLLHLARIKSTILSTELRVKIESFITGFTEILQNRINYCLCNGDFKPDNLRNLINSCFFSAAFLATKRGELRCEMTGPFGEVQHSSVAHSCFKIRSRPSGLSDLSF